MPDLARVLAWNPGGGADLAPALAALRAARPDLSCEVWTDPVAPDTLPDLVLRLDAARFAAVLIFAAPGASPFEAAYLAHLAGVPVRAGMSVEFGGGVLSPWVRPPPHGVPDPHLFLVQEALPHLPPPAPSPDPPPEPR